MGLAEDYAKHFGLNANKVKEAMKIAQAVSNEWSRRLGSMSEEEYDVLEGTLIKIIARKK